MAAGASRLFCQGEDEGGDGHKGASEGEPDGGVCRDEGVASFGLARLHVDHIILL